MKKILSLILLILTASFVTAADFDLATYPAPFVINGIFKAKIVVGQNAATSDVIGGIDIAASLIAKSQTDIVLGRMDALFERHVAIHDVDAPVLGNENLIVIGGPCVNSVAAELLDYPMPCHEGFEVGKAIIKYFPAQRALLVAGYDAQETLIASYILADHEDYKLKGLESEITVAGQGVLAINPVVT